MQLNEFNNSEDEDEYNEETDVEGEEDDDDDSDEDIDVFYYPDDEPLEQVLEIPVRFRIERRFCFLLDEKKLMKCFAQDEDCLETEDKETNTECVFVPEKGVCSAKRKEPKEMPSIIIKRSQTFSPVARTQYICRVSFFASFLRSQDVICNVQHIYRSCVVLQLNRSDSDSSMPLYRRSNTTSMPFRRNSAERRSLRWGRTLGSGSLKYHRHSFIHAAPRTSIDLELDLQAQHTRLQSLRDEISRLKNLKTRLETAKEKGDVEMAAWVLEDAQFQNLVSQVSF